MSSPRPRILVCPPTHFGIEYVINPWMEGHVGQADVERAKDQWEAFVAIVERYASVERLEPEAGLPDMCFTANGGFVLGETFVASTFRVSERADEVPAHRAFAASIGLEVVDLPGGDAFEGEGDALLGDTPDGAAVVWAGYGIRSSLESHRALAEALGIEVVSLRLIDERFYHLDTCFAPLPGGRVLLAPAAFDEASRRRIEARIPAQNRIEIDESDALGFAANALRLGDRLVAHQASSALRERLGALGFEVVTTPLDEFLKAGGGAKCLALDLRQDRPPMSSVAPSTIVAVEVESRGHLLATGALDRALDAIVDEGGSFAIEQLRAGERRDQDSHARLRVAAPDPGTLRTITTRLATLGFRPTERTIDATLERVTRAGVAPGDFHATTIYPTEVRIDGRWVRAEGQRMDAVLVVEPATDAAGTVVRCRLLRDLLEGDRVVCGTEGVRTRTPDLRSRREFGFMASSSSSERRVEGVVDALAREMRRLRARGGKIVVVAGPVVVHTGGGPHLAALVRGGYVQTLLAGNALAVHDIEASLYGTSLGIDLQRGTGVRGGHRHHLRAINRIREAGSIRAAVDEGVVTSGILFECVRADVEIVLAGSIRDDGPLPETRMDLVEAQRAYAEALRGADLVLMLATMLHSIGVGNMTPSGVRLVCVDIQPATVTKLADRGSLESTGVVTDVGPFLALLAARLGVGA